MLVQTRNEWTAKINEFVEIVDCKRLKTVIRIKQSIILIDGNKANIFLLNLCLLQLNNLIKFIRTGVMNFNPGQHTRTFLLIIQKFLPLVFMLNLCLIRYYMYKYIKSQYGWTFWKGFLYSWKFREHPNRENQLMLAKVL